MVTFASIGLDARWLAIDAEEVAAITQKFPNWAFERPGI